MAPITMIQLPMKMAILLPNVSLTHGTKGSAHMAPRLYAAEIIPSSAPEGLWKSAVGQRLLQICLS